MHFIYKKENLDTLSVFADIKDIKYDWFETPTKERLQEIAKFVCPEIEESLAVQLLDYLYYCVRKEEYIDNERVCNVRDNEQYDKYIKKMKSGCCGQTDKTVFVYDEKNDTYEIYMVGCNYGH